MSDTVEESGSNVRMFAAPLGTGRTRWRFESDPDGVEEPDDIVSSEQDESGASPSLYYSFTPATHAIARRG